MSRFLSFEKGRALFKTVIESQFKYSRLILIFHGQKTNYKTNKLYERALRIVCNGYLSSFQDMLNEVNSVSIYYQNIQFLATKIYKTFNSLSARYFEGIFM